MRGTDKRSGELFSYVDLEKRVRPDHPLRTIRTIANEALEALSDEFAALYSGMGRPLISPERLLRAMLLQAFYSIRSERQLMERLEFDLLFRWFVGLGVDDPVWDHSTFSKNRDRLLAGEIATRFLAAILGRPGVRRLLSTEHFSVDGTLIEAWASMKSFRPRDDVDRHDGGGGGRGASADFRGEKRSNATHVSSTDPDAMLYRKGPGMEARLCFIGHGLMENRSGLIIDARLTRVSGHAERLAALEMIEPHAGCPRAITLGADRGYDAADFVEELRNAAAFGRTSRETLAGAARRSIAAPPGTRATPPVSASANGSRRRSAGSRLSPACARPSCAAWRRSTGPLPLRPPPTIWCGCQGCSEPQREPAGRQMADRRDGALGQGVHRPPRAGLYQLR